MQLIKNIEASLYDEPVGEVRFLKPINGTVQGGIYINFFGYIAFLQDFSKTDVITALSKPATFGLKNTNNIPMVTLEINY